MVIDLPQPDDGKQSAGSSCGSGGGCSSGEPCGSGLEKVYPTVAVRYGYMKTVGEFRYASNDMKFGCGANVIIQTRRGIELGEMVSLTCDGCDKSISRDQIKSYVAASGSDYYHFGSGKILRLATADDETEWEHIRANTLRKKTFCQQRADEHNLQMKVLECEHLFGGERTIFYFMSEGRIDFRDLVRGLASEFRTRIEMRQVGARDEARLLADYETCGRECCCRNFLKALKPVSMKMAKMQKATLDPAKVSGRCGRLKCCLRYEHTTYEELDKTLPSMGKRIQTTHGPGRVIGRQILTQLILLATDDGGRLTIPVEDILAPGQIAPPSAGKPQQTRDSSAKAERAADPSGPRQERRPRKPDGKRDQTEATGAGNAKPEQVNTSSEATSQTPPAPAPSTQPTTPPSDASGSPAETRTDAPGVSGGEGVSRGQKKRGRRGRGRNRGSRKRREDGDSSTGSQAQKGSQPGRDQAGRDQAGGNQPGEGSPGGSGPSGGD
ncbi:MAG: hypothetical protein GXP29_08140 [Planctomycetes bacterium]|nr:hypothetical protein [Planctomycetota bacterium]